MFLIALTARAILAVLIAHYYDGTLTPDDLTYSKLATHLAANDLRTWDAYSHELYQRTLTFLWPLGRLYDLVGPHRLAGQLYVCVFGAAAAALTTALMRRVVEPPWAFFAGLAIALLPSQVLWSALILKDAAVWAFLAALALVAAVLNASTGWRLAAAVLGSAALLLGLAHLREHTMVVAAWSLALASLAASRHQFIPRAAAALTIAIGLPFVIGIGPGGSTLLTNASGLQARRLAAAEGAASAFIEEEPRAPVPPDLRSEIDKLKQAAAADRQVAGVLEKQIETIESKLSDGPGSDVALKRKLARLRAQQRARQERAERAEAQAAERQAKAEIPTGPIEEDAGAALAPNIKHLPLGLFVMLMEPVPWEWEGSASMRLARFEALVWYPLLLLAAVGLVRARSYLAELLFPILVGGGMLVLYALTEGNIGTAFRHRGEFVWVVAALAALGARTVITRSKHRDLRPDDERRSFES